MILGGGARYSAGLKNITAKHLGMIYIIVVCAITMNLIDI